MKCQFLLLAALSCVGGLSQAAYSQSFYQPALCIDGECQAAIEETTFFNRPAYRLTDGKTEVVVVPALGRIMRYGKVGGPNLLWTSSSPQGKDVGGWTNYGGDKTWLGPQTSWKLFHNSPWPPDKTLDGAAHEAEVISGGKLQLTSPLSPTGIRITRTISFSEKGEVVIEQSARKVKGSPIRASIWSITQVVPGEAIYIPTNPNTPYKAGFYWHKNEAKGQPTSLLASDLLRINPIDTGGGAKLNVDSPRPAIVSVHNGVAFVQKAPQADGDYPDGPEGAGFPVQLYLSGDPKMNYAELELLSPLREYWVGSKWTHTVRWSLHDLPASSMDAAVATLLQP